MLCRKIRMRFSIKWSYLNFIFINIKWFRWTGVSWNGDAIWSLYHRQFSFVCLMVVRLIFMHIEMVKWNASAHKYWRICLTAHRSFFHVDWFIHFIQSHILSHRFRICTFGLFNFQRFVVVVLCGSLQELALHHTTGVCCFWFPCLDLLLI